MPQRYALDYLELPSTDGPAMRKFFTDAFGWQHTAYGPDYAEVHAGLATGVDSSERRVAAPMPVVRAEDLEQAERDVVAAGGTITVPAYDFPGGRRFHFRAPGGVEFAVYTEKA
jgi:predicted enzyme related to lactoylglutathione lyase